MLIAHIGACIWISTSGEISNKFVDQYTNALYFLVTTATTTGYGDITAESESSFRVVATFKFMSAIVAILLGFQYFGGLIALNTEFLKVWKMGANQTKQEKEDLEDWFAARNQISGSQITWNYEKNVKTYQSLLVNKDIISKLSYGEYFEKLPYSWQSTIQLCTAYDLISAFEILKIVPSYVAVQIVLKYSYHQ